MSAFTSLKLIAAKRPQQVSPIIQRRNKLCEKLMEQMALATAMIEGKAYAPTGVRTVTDKETGERTTVESNKRVKQWWFDSNGRVCLQVKYGSRAMEFSKGKSCIDVGTKSDLLGVLQTVKAAVESGELDAHIESASTALRERFKH